MTVSSGTLTLIPASNPGAPAIPVEPSRVNLVGADSPGQPNMTRSASESSRSVSRSLMPNCRCTTWGSSAKTAPMISVAGSAATRTPGKAMTLSVSVDMAPSVPTLPEPRRAPKPLPTSRRGQSAAYSSGTGRDSAPHGSRR